MNAPTIPPARLPAAGPVNPPPHVSPDGAGFCINDCGGVERHAGGSTPHRPFRAAQEMESQPRRCESKRSTWGAGEAVGNQSGPQSPSDDFGLLRALPMAVALGLACYAVIAAVVILQ
jgi:hypothetical protein